MTFTFIVAGDPQYDQKNNAHRETENKRTVDRIKRVVGGVSHEVLGVIVVGDLIQSGDSGGLDLKIPDIDQAKEHWTKENLGAPVLEVYGNHDQSDSHQRVETFFWDGVVDYINHRNVVRHNERRIKDVDGSTKGLTAFDATNGHYAWEWDGVMLVNINDHAGTGNFNNDASLQSNSPRSRQARASLAFLERVLRHHVTPRQPVVLIQHVSFDTFSLTDNGGWWSPNERQSLLSMVQPHHVIAMFSGHSHAFKHLSGTYTETDNTTPNLPFDNFVTDATFFDNGAQGFLEVEINPAASPQEITVTRHFSTNSGPQLAN